MRSPSWCYGIHLLSLALLPLGCVEGPGDPAEPISAEAQLQQEIAAQAQLHQKLEADWRRREDLPSDAARIKLAINCMRTSALGATSVFDTPTSQRLTSEAKAFLLAHREEAFPHLLEFLRNHAESPPSDQRLSNVCEVLGEIGDRRAVLPLVEKLLAIRSDQYAPLNLVQAVAKIGDADTAPQLLRTYPYEEPLVQDAIVQAAVYARSADVTPTLLRLCAGSATEDPNLYAVYALARHRDPRAKDVFIDILQMPRARFAHAQALYGLLLLGEDPGQLELTDEQRQSLADRRRHPWPEPEFTLRYEDANKELRAWMDRRVAEKERQRRSPRSERGLHLELTAVPERVFVHGHVVFQARLVNRSTRRVKVMRSRDGSDVGWVMPKIRAQVWGPDHRNALLGVGRCGNVNPLMKDDLVELAPNASLDLFESGFGHYAFQAFPSKTPGVYQVKLEYDTTGKADGAIEDDGSLPPGVAAVRLESNLVLVEVISADDD